MIHRHAGWVVWQFAWLDVGAMLNHGSFKDNWTTKSLFWGQLGSHGCPGGAGGALQSQLWVGQNEVCKSQLRKEVWPCCMNVLKTRSMSGGSWPWLFHAEGREGTSGCSKQRKRCKCYRLLLSVLGQSQTWGYNQLIWASTVVRLHSCKLMAKEPAWMMVWLPSVLTFMRQRRDSWICVSVTE